MGFGEPLTVFSVLSMGGNEKSRIIKSEGTTVTRFVRSRSVSPIRVERIPVRAILFMVEDFHRIFGINTTLWFLLTIPIYRDGLLSDGLQVLLGPRICRAGARSREVVEST